jgi:hypothetical protein
MSRRSATVQLVVTAALAATLTGCAADQDYTGICVDTATQERLDDEVCDDVDEGYVGGGHGWFFIPAGRVAPAVGQPVSSSTGSFTVPQGRSYGLGGVERAGGTVSRGGFGGLGFGDGG